jgi:hypothetical protein
MLITFHSKAAPEILMRANDAMPLFRAAGKWAPGEPAPERGIFPRGQLAAAIAALEDAVRREAEAGEPRDPDPNETDAPPVHPVERKVALRQRAFPLLDMMRKSLAAGADITWEATRGA